MKKRMLSLVCAFISVTAFSQGIQTAADFFKTVSDRYASIQDYEASVSITAGRSSMQGKVSFKRPEMLRIDFSDPAEQVILFDGDSLTIYLPGYSAILEQNVGMSGVSAATAQGLALLKRYYTVAYETGQAAVPLDDGSGQMVVNLILYRRSASEAFSRIKLSIDPDSKLIMYVEATTPQGEVYKFRFTNYALNTGMVEQRFLYDPPSSANNYSNFLFAE